MILHTLEEQFSRLVRRGLCTEFYSQSGDPRSEGIGQLIFLELIECYLKDSCLHTQYDRNSGCISVWKKGSRNEKLFKMILKYTSTRKICEYYEKLLNELNKEATNQCISLILVQLNGGGEALKKIEKIDTQYQRSGRKLLRRSSVDGRIKYVRGVKKPFKGDM